MDILRYRPLFFWCAVFMTFLTAGAFLPTAGKWLIGGLFVVGSLIFALWRFRRHDGYRTCLALVAAVLACLALWRSGQAFQTRDRVELRSLEHTTVSVTGTVTDRRGASGYLTTYTLSLETVNGREMDGLAVLTCQYLSDLFPGNRVAMEAEVIPLSEAAGDTYDAISLLGEGYVIGFLSEDEGSVTVAEEESRHVLVQAGKLRRTLAARLDLLTGEESGGLPSALLLGDKSYLADSVRRDFTRAGVAHLLAISGLHMTLLFGMLAGVFFLLGIPKRIRALLLSAGVLGYLILLGFPPSATRAAIMLGMTYLSYLCSAQADSLTSLGLAGALILAVSPYAVADAGFWMSFLATLGLVTFIPAIQKRLEQFQPKMSPVWWPTLRIALWKGLSSIFVGLVAMSFTIFVVATVIGEIGVLSPIATLLLTPFCAGILVVSLFCLPLMGTTLGSMMGDWVRGISRVLIDLAEWLAEPSWVVVSLRHPAVAPAIAVITAVMTGVTLILLVVRLPARRRPMVLLPMLAGWIAVGSVLSVHGHLTKDEMSVTYLQPSSVSESLVLVSGKQGFVCDISNGSLSAMTAAVTAAKQQGATELATLMLTHYHVRTPGALDTILQRETVRSLWLPTPTSRAEYDLLLSCMEKADKAGVTLHLYDTGNPRSVLNKGKVMVERADLPRSQHPVLMVSLDFSAADGKGNRLVYCGSAIFESNLADGAKDLLRETDTVIFGSHGPLLQKTYGADMHLPSDCTVILSAYGDTVAYLDSTCLPDEVKLGLGQQRLVFEAVSDSAP